MLKQHLVRQNVAKDKPNEEQDLFQKKYFIRQSIPLLNKLPISEDRENTMHQFNSSNSKLSLQNTVKQIRQKRSLQSIDNEIGSFETSFSNNQQSTKNKFSLKLQIPQKNSGVSSPHQTPKLDKLSNNSILQRKQLILNDIESHKNYSQMNVGQKSIPHIQLQQKEIVKIKSKSFINFSKRNHSLTKVDDTGNIQQSHQNSQDDKIFKGQTRIRKLIQVNNQTNKNLQGLSSQVKNPKSPNYSKSPMAHSNMNSYTKFPFSNAPTQASGPFVVFQQKNETTPQNKDNKLNRRQSLNFFQSNDFQIEKCPSLPKFSDKKESRLASLSKISEEDKIKFKGAACKMYIEKRMIADDEDLQFVKQMEQDDEDGDGNIDVNDLKKKKQLNQNDLNYVKENEQKNNVQKIIIYDKLCERPSTVIGEQSTEIFYNHYKNINKVIQQNEYLKEEHSIKESLQTKLIKTIIDKNVLPKKLNLIGKKKHSNSLSFSNFNFGESSAQIIAEGLLSHPFKDSLQQFSLKDSYLNSSTCSTLLKSIPNTIIDLNISKNILDFHAINYIQLNFLGNNGRLQVLNAEKCKINDDIANSLLECLENNSSLRKLNLSQNHLTSKSCQKIKTILSQNFYLEELYLHWNQIKGDGGCLIAKGLQSNTTLTVLDLSKNPLGGDSTNKMLCSQEIKNFLMFQQTNLVHLDLSNCGFNQQESNKIKEGLIHNHTIYGFHFSGNSGFVDAQGYLSMNNYVNSFRNIHLNHRIEGVSSQNYMLNNERSLVSIDNCWICEGWEEQEISIELNQISYATSQTQVYAHVDFLQYTGILMQFNESSKYFTLKIMCPPNQIIKFFMTVPEQNIQINSQLHQDSSIQQLGINLPTDVFLQDGKVTSLNIKQDMQSINILKTKVGQVIDESTYYPLVSCIPRPLIMIADSHSQSLYQKKQSWSLKTSIWRRQALIDHKKLCKESFEFDFNSSKIPKLIKDETELEDSKNILLQYYEKLRDLYKGLSFAGAVGNNFFVSQNLFNEFMVDAEFIDNVNIKVSDIDVKFVASCASRPSNSIRIGSVSDRGLARFQFIEIIIRLIQEKYINSGLGYTITEALEDFFSKEQIKQILKKQHSSQKWRKKRLWNEECYLVIKEYMFFLQAIFNYYSNSTKNNTIKIKYMILEEYKQFCKDINCSQLSDRDLLTSYGYSIMYQVDELYQERYTQMQFLEFVEVIARLSEIANIVPKDYFIQNPDLDPSNKDSINLSFLIKGFLQQIYCNLPIEDVINQSLSSSLKYHLEQVFEKKGIHRSSENISSQTPSLKFTKNLSNQFGNQSKIVQHRKSASQAFNFTNFRDSKGFKKLQNQMNGQQQSNEDNLSQKLIPQLNSQKSSLSPLRASKRLSIYKQLELNNPTKKKDLQKIIQNVLSQNNQLLTSLSNFKKNKSNNNTNNDNKI